MRAHLSANFLNEPFQSPFFFFWPSGSSDAALGGVIKVFHDICECDLLPPPRSGVNHCGAHVLSHEIPLSHGGTLLNSAWQVLRLVLGRQTAEFHQRDGERLQPKVTDNLSLFFFFKHKLNLGSLELFNPASLAGTLLVFPFAGCSQEGSGCCRVVPWALEQNHLSVQPQKSLLLLRQRLL